MQATAYSLTEVYLPVSGYSLPYLTSFVKSLLAKLSKKKQQLLNKQLYNCCLLYSSTNKRNPTYGLFGVPQPADEIAARKI